MNKWILRIMLVAPVVLFLAGCRHTVNRPNYSAQPVPVGTGVAPVPFPGGPPAPAFSAPPAPKPYSPPIQQYYSPTPQYSPPGQQFQPPVQQFSPPVQQFKPPVQQYPAPVPPNGSQYSYPGTPMPSAPGPNWQAPQQPIPQQPVPQKQIQLETPEPMQPTPPGVEEQKTEDPLLPPTTQKGKQIPLQPPVEEKTETSPYPVGISQFAVAIPGSVTGGLRPMLDGGLDWLKKQGYKTVLHVKAPGQDDSADGKQVENRGMSYLSLEISPATLNAKVLEDFAQIVSGKEGYPLFVYDQDGSLAGGLWYLYFREVESLPEDVARVRANSLGLRTDGADAHKEMWLAIQKYLSEK